MYERYVRLRDSKGLRDSDVARKTGIPQSTFSDWKKGKSSPKQDKLTKIAECLGVKAEYLINGAGAFGYYFDEETLEIAQEIFENPEMRTLFDTARGSRPDDIRMVTGVLKRFKETNPDG